MLARLPWLLLFVAMTACPGPPEDPYAGPKVLHDWQGSVAGDPATFWDAPLPSEHRRDPDTGRPQTTGFPNPDDVGLVADLVALTDGTLDGFGVSSAIAFRLEEEPAASYQEVLADPRESLKPEAMVFLLDVQRDERVPVSVHYEADGGPFGAPGQLTLLPVQGLPLRPGALYAAVITRELRSWAGERLGQAQELRDLSGLGDASDAYEQVLQTLANGDLPSSEIAGLAVFRTQDPEAELRVFHDALVALPLPQIVEPFVQAEAFAGYCVYETTLTMPVFQSGEPPYDDGGGTLAMVDGVPTVQRSEAARVLLTLPRSASPAGGFPVATFIRTGGGGDRPLVERGVRDSSGEPVEPGSGPARDLAAIGMAGLSIDGPLGGLRNPTGGDEQFLVFNITNPGAMRDNVRQSALELTLVPALLASWTVDASDCAGLDSDDVVFDVEHLALIGHSMGATIAPLTLALERGFGAAVLSGAGGSWIHNVVYKQSPLEVRPLAEAILRYPSYGRELHEHDPALSLLQWGGEAADPPTWGPSVRALGTDVLMVQGIVDTYILPPMANAMSLSLGLDLGGPALDASDERLAGYTPLGGLLDLTGAEATPLPFVSEQGQRTAVVVQHLEDGVEDGHEVMFQRPEPKRQIACFLADFIADLPPSVPTGAPDEDCP